MKEVRISDWVFALKSGAYTKEEGHFGEVGTKNHCALGVIGDLFGKTLEGFNRHMMAHESAFFIDDAFKAMGIDKEMSFAEKIAQRNDNGGTFEEIAEILEITFAKEIAAEQSEIPKETQVKVRTLAGVAK